MTNKEFLRDIKKEAYQKAKAKRDADPRYQEFKERAKEQRKVQYRAIKERQKQEKLEAKQKRIAEKDASLMAFVMPGSSLENKDKLENENVAPLYLIKNS